MDENRDAAAQIITEPKNEKPHRQGTRTIVVLVILAALLLLFYYWANRDPHADEKLFSQSLNSKVRVYAEISSIVPVYEVKTTSQRTNEVIPKSYSFDFICRCSTSSGQTLWMEIGKKAYQDNFDSTISYSFDEVGSLYNSFFGHDQYEVVRFDDPVIVHGTVKDTDDIEGLREEIIQRVIFNFEEKSEK